MGCWTNRLPSRKSASPIASACNAIFHNIWDAAPRTGRERQRPRRQLQDARPRLRQRPGDCHKSESRQLARKQKRIPARRSAGATLRESEYLRQLSRTPGLRSKRGRVDGQGLRPLSRLRRGDDSHRGPRRRLSLLSIPTIWPPIARPRAAKCLPEVARRSVTRRRLHPSARLSGLRASFPTTIRCYAYYRWYWKDGDGWNGLNTAVHRGLQITGTHPGFWTFHDPAVRVARGLRQRRRGGLPVAVDLLLSRPDPHRPGHRRAVRHGGRRGPQAASHEDDADHLVPQPDGARRPRARRSAPDAASPWEDRAARRRVHHHRPDAPARGVLDEDRPARSAASCITAGSRWCRPTGTADYRYTHPETRHALKTGLRRVVQPLGPTLLQVPAAPDERRGLPGELRLGDVRRPGHLRLGRRLGAATPTT